MPTMTHAQPTPHLGADAPTSASALRRNLVIGLIAFLTVVDLFATQAILPSLAQAYGVTPAAMGLAVNASTSAWRWPGCGRLLQPPDRPPHRHLVSLALLAIPTGLLAVAPDLATFTALRIVQGTVMAAAFTLTLAYLGERCSAPTPPVPSRPMSPATSPATCSAACSRRRSPIISGLAANFYVFALLNLGGAALVWFWLGRTPSMLAVGQQRHRRSRPGPSICATRRCARLRHRLSDPVRLHRHLHLRQLRADPRAAPGGPDGARLRLLRLPAVDLTTPLAGRVVARFGTRPTFWGALGRRRRRAAAAADPEPAGRPRRPDPGRRRHVLRPGRRHRLHRPRRHQRPRSASGLYLASYSSAAWSARPCWANRSTAGLGRLRRRWFAGPNQRRQRRRPSRAGRTPGPARRCRPGRRRSSRRGRCRWPSRGRWWRHGR